MLVCEVFAPKIYFAFAKVCQQMGAHGGVERLAGIVAFGPIDASVCFDVGPEGE